MIDLARPRSTTSCRCPCCSSPAAAIPCRRARKSREKLAANLRDYIDRGGFIFADGEGCSSEFDKGFRDLMELVFQKPEYRFKPLDASHPIWIADQKIPPDQVRLLLGIDYGCRTSVVYAPCHPPGDPKPSLACLWELSRGGQRASYSPAVQEKIRGGLAIGINVLAYATNREFKEKDLIPETVVIKGPADKNDRGKFAVAKLQHPGGCDAAPRALANLMEQAGHELNIRVETHPKLIGMQDPALFDYAVVFMHGRNAFRLTDGERKALREYVERGGLLFADAICGNEAFAESFRREMGLIFPEEPLGEHPAPRPDLDEQVRRFRSQDGHASRPAAGPAGRTAEVRPAPRSARIEGRSFRRPLWRDLLGVRSELCPGEARFDGMPRLHPRRRRTNRPERAALRDATVAGNQISISVACLPGYALRNANAEIIRLILVVRRHRRANRLRPAIADDEPTILRDDLLRHELPRRIPRFRA